MKTNVIVLAMVGTEYIVLLFVWYEKGKEVKEENFPPMWGSRLVLHSLLLSLSLLNLHTHFYISQPNTT